MENVYQKWRVAMFGVWVLSGLVTVAVLLGTVVFDAM